MVFPNKIPIDVLFMTFLAHQVAKISTKNKLKELITLHTHAQAGVMYSVLMSIVICIYMYVCDPPKN